MISLVWLLQYLLPLALVLGLIWRFLVVPAVRSAAQKIEEEEDREERLRRIREEFPDEATAPESLRNDLDEAIRELKEHRQP